MRPNIGIPISLRFIYTRIELEVAAARFCKSVLATKDV